MLIEHQEGPEGQGCIYAFYYPSQKSGDAWPLKIGKTRKHPFNRIGDTSMQEEPVIATVVYTPLFSELERHLHRSFASVKMDSFGKEWFITNPANVLDAARGFLSEARSIDMAASKARTLSPYTKEALLVLGQLIRINRIEKKMTVKELADRIGISRGVIQRIERGDPSSLIGSFFEAAAILGVRLYDADIGKMTKLSETNSKFLDLMPKAARKRKVIIDDDF